ncbi:MAG: ribonuclease E activity regulator RraA, partial [Devosia sp.]
MLSTCDLYDQHLETIGTLPPALIHFGAISSFSGAVETVKCFEDNSKVKQLAESPGHGRVLVVDAGGSVRHALVGDLVAKAAMDNGWAGIVLWGAVRDMAALRALDVGIMAIARTPRKSVRNGEGQVGIDIRIGDVRIASGDFLVADEDGALL